MSRHYINDLPMKVLLSDMKFDNTSTEYWRRDFESESWFNKLSDVDKAYYRKNARRNRIEDIKAEKREVWAKENLKVGDIVKMQGASRNGLREVEALDEYKVICRIISVSEKHVTPNLVATHPYFCSGNILFKREPHLTEHMYNKVLKVYNVETSKLESVI